MRELFSNSVVWWGVVPMPKSWFEEGQETQWPKEKGSNDKQRSTKHYIEN